MVGKVRPVVGMWSVNQINLFNWQSPPFQPFSASPYQEPWLFLTIDTLPSYWSSYNNVRHPSFKDLVMELTSLGLSSRYCTKISRISGDSMGPVPSLATWSDKAWNMQLLSSGQLSRSSKPLLCAFFMRSSRALIPFPEFSTAIFLKFWTTWEADGRWIKL